MGKKSKQYHLSHREKHESTKKKKKTKGVPVHRWDVVGTKIIRNNKKGKRGYG